MNRHKVFIGNAWRAEHPRVGRGELSLVLPVAVFQHLRRELIAGGVAVAGPGQDLIRASALCAWCPHWIRPEHVEGSLAALRANPGLVTAVNQRDLEEVLAEAVLHGGALVGPVLEATSDADIKLSEMWGALDPWLRRADAGTPQLPNANEPP